MTELLTYDYQEKQISECSKLIGDGKRCIINQLNTGGGKTVEFASIAFRYYNKNLKRVFIMVDREELMDQICSTITEWYDMDYQQIKKGNNAVYDRSVYIGMVETVFRRLSKNANYFPEVGLVILDEAHVGNFKKIHSFFPNAIIIGFTATPIYTDSKYPINRDYEDIVVGPQVNELIARNFLCQNITYSIEEIDRSTFGIKMNDFDNQQMSKEYSKHRHVKNVVDKYEELAPNTKAICYNVSVEHSKLVMEEFRKRGYDCRHVDGKTDDEERTATINWFSDKRPTILCNVGIITKGYDNPYVLTIISNFSSLSLTKCLQCWGRGGRICKEINKTHFTIIDMGGNARFQHGDWNKDRDWRSIFFEPPKKKKKEDAAPYKTCKKCSALIPVNVQICPYCGYEYPKKQIVYDTKEVKLELITKNLNVQYLAELYSDKNEYYTLFYIENNLITQAKYRIGLSLNDEQAENIINTFMIKAEEWCHLMDKDWRKLKRFCNRHINDKLRLVFKYEKDKSKNIVQIEDF